MSSWGSDPDAPGGNGSDAAGTGDGSDADRRGGAPAPPPGRPAAPAGTGLPMSDRAAPGDDPLPSAGSLRWAPDVTERVPVVPPAASTVPPAPATVPPAPAQPIDPPQDPTGASPHTGPPAPPAPPVHTPAHVGAPTSPAYADPPSRTVTPPRGGPPTSPPPGPSHLGGRTRHRRRSEAIVLGALGVLVVVVGVAALAISRGGDDGTDAPGPTTDAPVAGPVVGPTGVVGTWDGSAWQRRPDGDQPGAGLDYSVVGLDDAVGSAAGVAVSEDCPSQRGRSELDVAVVLEPTGDGPPPVAVAGVDDPLPRPIEQFDTGSATYRDAAAEVARGLGASTEPTLTQVLRVDLDGNGTQEVVVAAEHIADSDGLSGEDGDWSVVFHRRVVGNGAATDVLASSVVGGGEGGEIERIQVAAIADLNGDGTMEVALDGRSASGRWTSVHALDGEGVPSEVLKAGCEG